MMATFKTCIYANHLRKDGTYNIKLRILHLDESRRISTPYDVEAKYVNTKLEVLDPEILNYCEDLCYECRKICRIFGFAIERMSIDELVAAIRSKLRGEDEFSLDFCNYWREEAVKMRSGTGSNYLTALSAFKRFTGKDTFNITQVTTKLINQFKEFIENEPSRRGCNRKSTSKKGELVQGKTRAVSMYVGCMRAIYNRAKLQFNDEDTGIVPLPRYPFAKIKLSEPIPRKRAIPLEIIQRIIDLPYKQDQPRYNLAKDCFLLSFGLAGINSVDLYSCKPAHNGVLVYYRQKTRTRRADQAEMHIRIEPMIQALVKKYTDVGAERQFQFYRLYANFRGFNRAINIGLKSIALDLGLPSVQYYAARHSWATIGRSHQANIEKATIHEGLNHSDPAMKVTDIYVDRDWAVIWEANLKILKLLKWYEI